MSDITSVVAVTDDRVDETSYFTWRAAIAGAVFAAALAAVLDGFAASLGLSISSTSPSWRDTSTALVLLGGLFILFIAIVAYGVGGYLTGRGSAAPIAADQDEIEFRDGLNGLLAWALATLLALATAYGAAQISSRLSSAGSAPASTVAGENLIAFDLDRLFRGDRNTPDLSYPRAEAARILLTANGHEGMRTEDHDYLVRLVSRETGLAAADATRRVDTVAAQAKDDVARARRTGVILGFMAAASALAGAVVAWAAAVAGGRHRDHRLPSHLWRWGSRPRSRAIQP